MDLKGQYIGEFKEIGSLVDWSMGKWKKNTLYRW